MAESGITTYEPTTIWENSDGIATGYLLDGPGSIPDVARFSPLYSVQRETVVYSAPPPSNPVSNGSDFHGLKATGT
jgi:hypothetical protein